MKRRQFIKSVAATTTVPLLPSPLASALPVSAMQYAKAVEIANKWAYTTAYYLKLALKVDDPTSEAVLARLQTDGIIGPKGPSGICISERMSVVKSGGLAKATSKISGTDVREHKMDALKRRLVKADEGDAVEKGEEAPEPTTKDEQTGESVNETPELS